MGIATPAAHQLLKDKWFQAALVAALPFWAMLWVLQPPPTPLDYLAANPVAFLMVAAAYPVVEEIVFRGALQGYLIDRITWHFPGPVSPANAATSIVFAAFHLAVWASPGSLLVFFPSLVYGYFREKTGGLMAPILLHAFYNAGFFLVTAP